MAAGWLNTGMTTAFWWSWYFAPEVRKPFFLGLGVALVLLGLETRTWYPLLLTAVAAICWANPFWYPHAPAASYVLTAATNPLLVLPPPWEWRKRWKQFREGGEVGATGAPRPE